MYNIFTQLLSIAIRQRKPDIAFLSSSGLVNPDKTIDFQLLFNISVYQDVSGILWPTVRQLVLSQDSIWNTMPKTLYDTWADTSGKIAKRQLFNEMLMQEFYQTLGHEGIPVMALKGEAIRARYPWPEYRNMCDVDVLVKAEDLDRAVACAKKLGYTVESASQKHVSLFCSEGLMLEIHQSIIDERYPEPQAFSSTVWETAIPYSDRGPTVYALSRPYQMLYLLMHYSCHLLSSGNWIRQICDIVLTCEQTGNREDFPDIRTEYETLLDAFHMRNISDSTLYAAHYMLGLNTPVLFPEAKQPAKDVIDGYIQMLLIGNIYETTATQVFQYFSDSIGKIDPEQRETGKPHSQLQGQGEPGKLLRQSQRQRETEKSPCRFRRITNFLFPPTWRLSLKYRYAKEHKFLLPIAWIHRILYGLKRNDIPQQDKYDVIFQKESQSRNPDREKLLKDIGIL